jgi:hypothetical protein
MENKSTPLEVLFERAQEYTRTSIELLKLKLTDKLAEVVSNLASSIIVLAIFVLFFINLNIGLALLLGDLLGKVWLGFVFVSGGYAIIGVLVYLFRESWIKRPLSDSIITQMLKDDTENFEGSDA